PPASTTPTSPSRRRWGTSWRPSSPPSSAGRSRRQDLDARAPNLAETSGRNASGGRPRLCFLVGALRKSPLTALLIACAATLAGAPARAATDAPAELAPAANDPVVAP